MEKKVFLISNSEYQGVFWDHCFGSLGAFMGAPEKGRNKILFIPFAKTDGDYDGYTKLIAMRFSHFGYEVVGMHTYRDYSFLLDKEICAVCVGEGNVWLLANEPSVIYSRGMIQNAVDDGRWKYIGAGAGAIMACNSMITTNDMCPVSEINSTCGFGIIPFQINPHFVPELLTEKNMGKTQEERIKQVILRKPHLQVVGLQERCWIEGIGEQFFLRGNSHASIFRKDGNNSTWLPNEPFDSSGMM